MKLKRQLNSIYKFIAATRRRKLLSLLLISFLLITGAFLFIARRGKVSDICKTQMKSLDAKVLSLEPTFEKTNAQAGSQIIGKYISYTIDSSSPTQTFNLKDTQGNEGWVKIIITAKSSEKPTINKDALVWKEILPEIDLEQNTYKDALQNTFTLKDVYQTIQYQIEKSEKIFVEEISGGMIAVKSTATSEELLVFKYPQGIDTKGERIDFSLKLEADTISLVPHRDWQLGCGTTPVTLYSQITAVAWDEALVKVGDNCDGVTCEKDGDIMEVKPAGWNWGIEERKSFALIRIPKSSSDQRVEYSSRTIEPPDPDDFDEKVTPDEAFAALPEIDKPKVFEYSGLARYAIDYTALSTPDQLKDIRNPKKESPILDATAKPEVIIKKPDPRLSIIPTDRHLAFAEAEKLSRRKTLWDKIMPTTYAEGAVVKTIGTASGRDFSTIQLWEDNQDGDLVAAKEIHVGEMYKDSEFDITTNQFFDNATTANSSYYMHLTAAEGERHNGKEGSGVVVDCQGSSIIGIRIEADYTRVEWIEVKNCNGNTATVSIGVADTGTAETDGVIIQNVIVHSLTGAAAAQSGIGFTSMANGGSMTVRNCIVYEGGAVGIRGTPTTNGTDATIENCTIYGSGTMARGIDDNSSVFTVRNAIAMDTTTGDFDLATGSSLTNVLCEDNLSDCNIGTLTTCTDCLFNKNKDNQFVSNTAGAENFHLKSGSDAIDNGTTPSGFATDIDLESRPQLAAWDIGADEYSTDDAVGFWKFDEGVDNTCPSGTNDACDSSGNVNDGAISGGTAWKPDDMCVNGKCLFFDGTDDVVTVNNSNSLDFDLGLNTGVTFAAWVRVNSDGEANTGEIFDKGDATSDFTYLRITNEGADGLADLEASLALGATGATDDATATVTNGITLNQWHYVAMAYTDDADDEITVYIDGKSRATSINGVGSPESTDTNNLLIGGSSTTNFHGFIDMFKVYPYERTSDQIKTDLPYLPAPRGSSAAFDPPYLSDGLVGYWKADETSGNMADSSGNATTLTDTNTVAFVGGKFDQAGDFELDNSEYQFAADNDVLSITDSLTLSAWIRPETVTAGTYNIIAKWDGSNESYRLMQNADEIRLELDSAGNYQETTASNLAVSTFYHVVGVYDATTATAKIYINGLEATSSTTGTIPSSIGNDTGRFHIGAEDSTLGATGFYDGFIDDARVYKRAFSPREVLFLSEWGPSPVSWWKLDENTGTTAYDSGEKDNNGSLGGSPIWTSGKYGQGLKTTAANVSVPDPSDGSLDFNATDSFTFTAWVNTSVTVASLIMNKGNFSVGGGGDYQMRISSAGNPGCRYHDGVLAGGASVSGTSVITDGKWHYVACVRDGSGSTNTNWIYVDGVLESTATDTLGSLDTPNTSALNFPNTSTDINGSIDNLKVYRYAISSKQVVEDMNAGHPVPGSPVGSAAGYWKFDEGSLNTCSGGTNDFCDSNSLANDLTFSTTTGGFTNSGRFGKAFDGTGSVWASRADDNDFDFTDTDNFSITGWFNHSVASAQEIILQKFESTGADGGYVVRMESDGDITFGTDNDNTAFTDTVSSTAATYDDGTWHHFAAVKTGTTDIRLYIDAVLVGTTTVTETGGTLANNDTLYIADSNGVDGGDEFNGDLDEIKIYRLALTADQVKVEYNRGSQSLLGSLGTTSAGVADWSSERSYCPPGDTTANCSPVGEWLLDEYTGTTVNDTSGNGNNASFNSSPIWTPCKIGPCLEFDGTDDNIENTSVSSALNITGNLTVSAWVYRDTTSTDDAIAIVDGDGAAPAGNIYYVLYINDATSTLRLEWQFGATPTLEIAESTSALSNASGAWVHVAATRDTTANEVIFYENGRKLGNTVSFTNDPDSTDTTADLNIGSRTTAGGDSFDGKVDHVRVYNYELTPAQIAWDYNRGNPVGWWKFDECTGYFAYDAMLNAHSVGTTTNPLIATVSATVAGTHTSPGNCNSSQTSEMRNNGTTGKLNASLDFDGADDFVNVPDNAVFDFADGANFTLEAWINRESFTTDDTVIAKKTTQGNTTAGYILWIDDSTDDVRLVVSDGDSTNHHTVDSTSTFTETGWNHIVVVYDDSGASNSKIYINGRDDAATNTTTGTFSSIGDLSNSVPLRFGAESDATSTDEVFDGKIDNVRVYNYAVTAIQARTLYNEASAVRFGPNTGSP